MYLEQIETVLKKITNKSSLEKPLSMETDFRELGVDSLILFTMIIELEKMLGIRIPDDAFSAANFRTVGDMNGILSKLCDETQ